MNSLKEQHLYEILTILFLSVFTPFNVFLISALFVNDTSNCAACWDYFYQADYKRQKKPLDFH